MRAWLFPRLSIFYTMHCAPFLLAILRCFLFHCDMSLGCRIFAFLKVHLEHVGVSHAKRKPGDISAGATKRTDRDAPFTLGRHCQVKQLDLAPDRLCGPCILHSRLNRVFQKQTKHPASGEQAKDGTNDQPKVEAGGRDEAEHA